ncbi:MAG TPA: radical SAM protein [Xanthobacteraceae bacterium]|nr:radical SAM protein [Xanthobacteraceae bacterium]
MLGKRQKLARLFRDIDYLRAAKRGFDDKPLQCSLYVTDRCNLDCAYCTEYDNSQKHPPLSVLKERLKHIRSLGTLRVALVGGEPLLHPDIVEIVRYARTLGFSTSLTTNGFPLTRELVRGLEEAGLEVMQISVDRVTPSDVSRKSLKSVAGRIEMLRESTIKLHITGTICADTAPDALAVLEYGLSRNIPTEVRLVHAGPDQMMRVPPAARQEQRRIIETMIARKKAGEPVHTSDVILRYQLKLIDGENVADEWQCAAGYKIFFVSARGKFMECSMRPTNRDILDIKREDLRAYFARKDCQKGCGVYCAVSTSLYVANPVRFVAGEVGARLKQAIRA